MRNAFRGLIGGLGVVSGTGAGCRALCWEGTPARALSRCCDVSCAGESATRDTNAARVAGECGNRTHPTLLSRVTVILKITEATRPHPPPKLSLHLYCSVRAGDDFANYYSTVNTRKIVGDVRSSDANEEPAGRLRIT